MVIITKSKSVRVTAIPEDDEDEKKTKDLVEQMRSELHELNENQVTEEDDELEERKKKFEN